jgi:hypothetical protein
MNMNMQYSDCSTKNKSWEEIFFFFRRFYLYIVSSMVMILLY